MGSKGERGGGREETCGGGAEIDVIERGKHGKRQDESLHRWRGNW
jgi:hypothetical protein